jgi:hypothetical protein
MPVDTRTIPLKFSTKFGGGPIQSGKSVSRCRDSGFSNNEGNMKNNLLNHVRSGIFILPFILCSCAAWHKVQSPPPQFTVYPTLSLKSRLAADSTLQRWKRAYTSAVANASPWKPDEQLLRDTYINASQEFDLQNPAAVTDLVSNAFKLFSAGNNGLDADAPALLTNKIMRMFELTDKEQASLFVDDPGQLKTPPRYSKSHFLSTRLPTTVSAELPVGVSVTPVWQSGQGDAPSKTEKAAKPAGEKVVADKLLLTVQAASSAEPGSPPKETASPEISDFQPDQKITINISTVLNSPSVLDRIEYVSTYVYIFPWQDVPNGNVVLERELWRDFFSINSIRDPLIRSKMLTADLRRAIEDMRVQVRDIGTTVQYNPVDLGSLSQTTTDTSELGLNGTLSALAPPTLPSVAMAPKYIGVLSTVANIQLKQQLDQRSTYIDPPGDFFRITQRGMQSVNLAGRFKEMVTLNIPAATEQFRVLAPKAGNSKNKAGKSSQAASSGKTNNEASPEESEKPGYEEMMISQPLYSRVEGITFSVVVAREATHLLHSSRDRYGLEDARNASFIADVTFPELITLWQWERSLDAVQTSDIFGKSDAPAKAVYFRTYPEEQPSPLYLANFSPQQRLELISAIRKNWTNNVVTVGGVDFGLPDKKEHPTNLTPLTP